MFLEQLYAAHFKRYIHGGYWLNFLIKLGKGRTRYVDE